MIGILPNWHPIFVHFVVALFSTSFVLYALAYITKNISISKELEIAARWCLWCAGLATIPTVLAGLYAYNTVMHDAPSHAAMTNHRNWGLPTAGVIAFLSIWSLCRYYYQKTVTLIFLSFLFITQCMLLSTAWRGGELVYRFGLGVMSMPQQGNDGHEHNNEDASKMQMPDNNHGH